MTTMTKAGASALRSTYFARLMLRRAAQLVAVAAAMVEDVSLANSDGDLENASGQLFRLADVLKAYKVENYTPLK